MSHKNLAVIFAGFLIISSAVLFSTEVDATGITATVQLGLCGDGSLGTEEQCDGSALGGTSCTSRGFSGGTLTCDASCNFDTSACITASGNTVTGGGGSVSNGGGGSAAILATTGITVRFDGSAYPGARVTLLRDGAPLA